MARYNGEDYEDLDEYEDEGEDQEVENVGEEEYEEREEEEEEEEEEAPRHTQEELEYLELRQRIKESIRKQMKKESGSSRANAEEKKLPYLNFGSFFGPSQPVIAQRVIQESKSLLENQHLVAKVSRPHHDKSRSSTSTAAGSKVQSHGHRPKENEVKVNAQTVKQTRDYSFLLADDAGLPAPTKDPPPRPVSVPNSEARSAHAHPNGKRLSDKTVRQVSNGREERKSMSTGSQMHPKAGSHKLTSASRPILTSVEHRKKLGNSNGSGPGRPLGPKDLATKKQSVASERRVTTAVAKSSPLSVQKPPPSKLQSSASNQPSILRKQVDQKKQFQEYRKEKVPLKPQMNRPPAKISSRHPLEEDRPKKKAVRQYSDQEEDVEDYRSAIRQMFRYDPSKYAGRDDDDSDMEADFHQIEREEKRSSRIARKEDEEELRKIEEEERREKLRQQAKKRKLSQH